MLVGALQMSLIFTKKIRGTIAYFVGFILLILNYKLFGVVIQMYAIYEFFKSIAVKLLSYLTIIPVVGPYVQQLIDANDGFQKKNDKTQDV